VSRDAFQKWCGFSLGIFCVLLLIVFSLCLWASDFLVTPEITEDGQGISFHFPSGTDVYFQVWASDSLTSEWTQVRGMTLGEEGTQAWKDATAITSFTGLYYRLRRLPISDPDDYDGDGMDDVFELRHPSLLNPLDPSDGWMDTDDDGMPDWWEVLHFGSVTGASWWADADEDRQNNLEEYQRGTDPHNWDTDGDGASDGDEIAAGTDPLNNPGDSDSDGLGDDLEIVLGTDPYLADSDLDWAGDGYELQWGFNPLDSDSTPPRRMILDDGAQYTRSTNITVSLPGMVAEHIIIGETSDLTNGVLYAFSQQVEYGLQSESNGVRTLYARLYRDTVVQSPLISESVIFDNVAPTISELSPTNGASTDRRWIMVSGVATDAFSAVQVFIDGQWADGVTSEGLFQYDRHMLSPGTNGVVITARDKAGNIATQQLDVVQDTSGDTTPPSIALIMPRDFEVDGGVTNWLDQTTFGTNEVLYVQGVTDDETADVRLMVHAEGQTNGPSPAVVVGTQVWGSVHLFPGTNLLEALASDAAGNTATSTWVIIRDTNFFFEITSPVAYQQMNSPSVTVYGVASPAFLTATITVNGVETAITNQGTHVSFATLSPVPLNVGRTEIGALAMLDGRSYYADPPVVGYEVLQYNGEEHYTFDNRWRSGWHYATEIGWMTFFDEWDALTKIWTTWSVWAYDSCSYSDTWGWSCDPQYGNDMFLWYFPYFPSYGFENARFGNEIVRRNDSIDATTGWTLRLFRERKYDDQIVFIKHWPTVENQLVIFHFDHLDYRRAPGEPFEPSLITFRGQTGFWFNGRTAFLIPIKTETEYTITANDFKWPEYSYIYSPPYDLPWVEKGHYLHVWGQLSNILLSVDMTAYRPQTETAGYGNPFQRTAVPAGEKESPGVGIRVNGDDDNNNSTPDRNDATVNNENDLIEVVLNAAPPATSGGFTYVLKRSSSNIKVWNSATKGTALLDANNETNLTFSTTPMTVWVENSNGGTADLELQAKTDSGTVVCSDKIHFYPFQAIVVGLSGEVWPGGNPLANGMFDVAQELYQRGFDAHYYDEDVVGNNGAGAAYDEVVRAIQHRQVTRVAVYGHSHGGGSTHDLAERLNANRGTIGTFTISFTAYVDAIENDSDFDTDSEVRLPPSTAYHMNYFQTVDLLLVGGAVPGANENLNVNTTQWGQNLNHGAIDNDPNVINAVRDRAIQQVQP